MKLHDLFDVLSLGCCIKIVQRIPGDKDWTVYNGTIDAYPYHLMRDYGDRTVLEVGVCKICLTDKNGVYIVINRDEEDY